MHRHEQIKDDVEVVRQPEATKRRFARVLLREDVHDHHHNGQQYAGEACNQ